MKVLISPVSLDEAREVALGGADIIDIKNTKEGSLGASFPWIIRSVVTELSHYPVTFSATLGDLPFKPGTASLAALGAAAAGAKYIKAGLKDVASVKEGVEMMNAVKRACKDYDPDIIVVTAGYADYRSFNGLSPADLVKIAGESGTDVVMLDTALKNGKTLFDNLSMEELAEFIDAGHEIGQEVALAGSVQIEHIGMLLELKTDIVGVRGAVCNGKNRNSGIEAQLVKRFINSCRLESAV
jgi:(5-formylfuran-3-yl)methyl phosphate synthase